MIIIVSNADIHFFLCFFNKNDYVRKIVQVGNISVLQKVDWWFKCILNKIEIYETILLQISCLALWPTIKYWFSTLSDLEKTVVLILEQCFST